jgi:hypothetical protein
MFTIRMIAAAAALAAVGSANALTMQQITDARAAAEPLKLKEIRIAGASALRLSVAAYAKEICNTSDFHIIWNSNSEGTGHRAYSCTLAVAQGNYGIGTPVLIYKRDAGGSGQGVAPIALAADQTHMKVIQDATCTTINGGDTPATDPAVPNYICTGTETTGIKSDAGISDVEPALLQGTVNLPTGAVPLTASQLGNLNGAPLVQALFGVAVNKKAYRALQEAQGIIPAGGALLDMPVDQATWTAADIATMPSLSSAFVTGALTGQVIGGTANTVPKKGWNAVIPLTVDANAITKTMNICRRTEGSGTQAVSNAFFANNPCANSGTTQYAPAGVAGSSGNAEGTGSVVATVTNAAPNLVQEGTSAGQVENCLLETENAVGAPDNIAYGIAVLGREANPRRTGDLGYRYVKLDGVAPVRLQAKAGNYPLVYEATMQWNNLTVPAGSDKALFLTALRSGFGSPNGLAAVDSDTQQGVMSPPAAYAGAYADAVGNAALFGSRVSRVANQSCAPLRITK